MPWDELPGFSPDPSIINNPQETDVGVRLKAHSSPFKMRSVAERCTTDDGRVRRDFHKKSVPLFPTEAGFGASRLFAAADPFLHIPRSCRDFSNDPTRGRRFVLVQV